MSISLMSLVFYIRPNLCDKYEKFVLLALADHANDEGRSVYPSEKRIAFKCSMSIRGVEKVISRLLIKQLIRQVRQGGGNITNEYEIDVDKLRSISVDPSSRSWGITTKKPKISSPEHGSGREHQSQSHERGSNTPERGSDDPSINIKKSSLNRNEEEYLIEEVDDKECEEVESSTESEQPKKPKWMIPTDNPYLKRAMAIAGQKYFTTRDQKKAWAAVEKRLKGDDISKDWIENCLDYAEDVRMPLANLLKWMANTDKMRDWENRDYAWRTKNDVSTSNAIKGILIR